MSARTPYPGIGHGDRVLLTGEGWSAFPKGRIYEVDDKSFHRPVIYEKIHGAEKIHWFLFNDVEGTDFSVTKVEA